MIINELLAEKYRIQKLLDGMAKHDLATYVANTHLSVQELADTLELRLNYGRPGEISQLAR